LAVKENLRQTLGYELEKFIPLSAEDIHFDYQIISEDKESDQLKLLLVVVKKETLAPYLELLGRLGMGISGIEISSTALAEYFLYQERKNSTLPLAFVYFGEDGIELGFLEDGTLDYSRMFAGDVDKKELVETLLNELDRIQQLHGETDTPLEMVICAGEERLFSLEALKEAAYLDAHPVDLSRTNIPTAGIIPAYGLALKGLQKAGMRINLLPLQLRKKPSKIASYALFVLAGLLLLTALAWGGGVVLKHRWALERLDEEINRLSTEISEVDKIRIHKETLESRINYLSTLQSGSAPVLDVLRELSIRIPEDAWVNQFDFSDKGVTLNGEAASASELIPLLEDSPIFKNVAFLSTISKTRDGKERFRIGLNLN
jgi:Tfp pilus assembly protein PilN